MRIYQTILIAIIMIGTVAGQDLNDRVLLVFGKDDSNNLAEQQLKLFDKNKEALEERSLKITVVPNISELFKKYQVKPHQFMLILIGRDKYRKI